MRAAFTGALLELAEKDPRIMLLTADLGYLVLEPFAERFPDRFVNVGVAEENMIGLATGLAEAGFIPFVYSIVTFAVLRPYEFIRNGPILHQLPIRIVGVGGGLEYSRNGISHYGLEDIAVLRTQPSITLIAPADFQQARIALLKTWNVSGPVYYRLSKDDKTLVSGLNGRFELGHAQLIGNGGDILIISMGSITNEAVVAAERLASRGISTTVMVIASVSPAPLDDLVEVLSCFRLAITVEAHYIVGGIGSLVSEVVAERGLRCRIVRCGVKTKPDGISGSLDYLYNKHGISAEMIASRALQELC